MFSSIDTDNGTIKTILKDSQIETRISIIYILPVSLINNTLLSKIKSSGGTVIITWEFNIKQTEFNFNKADQWGIASKKSFYGPDIFVAEKNISKQRDSRTNTRDITNCVISSLFYNNIQIILIKNELSSGHSAILFNFGTKINKSISPPFKVKLYHKANWDHINSSFSNQLAALQDQISHLINSKNSDFINIINKAAKILTETIMNIHNYFQKKSSNGTLAFHWRSISSSNKNQKLKEHS